MKRCAYIPCGRVVVDTAHHRKSYCSPVCKGRQASRKQRAKKQAHRTILLDAAGNKRRVLTCQLVGCGEPIAPERHPNSRYCSSACKMQSRSLQALAYLDRKNAKKGKAKRVPRKVTRPKSVPMPAPVVEVDPLDLEPPPPPAAPLPVLDTAGPCQGCRWVKAQPASWRGVECSKGLFLACNPLSPAGPKLKEAA